MSDARRILRDLAALRCCRQALEVREKDDLRLGWLWQMKKKVARLLIKDIEGCLPSRNAPVAPLTQKQQQRIQAEHPLLKGDQAHVCEEPRRDGTERLAEARGKVEKFMAAQYGHAPPERN